MSFHLRAELAHYNLLRTMIKKGSLAKRAEKLKKPIVDQQSNLPILKTPKLKAISLPKLKSRDSSQAITAANVPGPVLRILLAISQTLDEDLSKDDMAHAKESSAFQSTERTSSISSRDETCVLVSEMSRVSISSSLLDSLETEVGEFNAEKSSISNEAKRKIIRCCLDLKRLIDKDNNPISADSVIQKSLFSKSNTNVTVLFRCLKEICDVDTSIVITNLLLRLITSCESASSNMIMMTKKNLCQVLLVTIYNIHHDYLNNSSIPNLSLNILQKIDDIFNNTYTILCRLSKYEPKLALLARLHGAVPITVKALKRSVERKDIGLMTITFNMLRIFASKNVIQKSNLVPLLDGIFKNLAQQVNSSKFDNAIELMAYLAKSKSTAQEIVKTFGMKFFLGYSCSVFEGLQKAALKAIKILNEYASECVNMSLTSVNSVTSLLVGALRSAAGQADLPFLEFYTDRNFPLPTEPTLPKTSESRISQPKHFESAPNLYTMPPPPPVLGQRPKTSPNLTQCVDYKDVETDYEDIVDEFAQDLQKGKSKGQAIPPQSIQDLVHSKLRKLCPELSYLENIPIAKCDTPNSNISVRHVQPMAPGKHFVCRNLVNGDSEQLLRRSPMIFRKPGVDSSTLDSVAADANTFSTLVMAITFKTPNDTCYFAYHYPYTYSELQRSLYQLSSYSNFKNVCRRALLCRTLGGNDCILLTITDFVNNDVPIKDRKYVLLSARVHPGESNSSHMMNGLIQFLLSGDETAVNLRKNCVFKIVPMLNPDGTINGSHRCSLAGFDLNRQWKSPSRVLSPTIFWTKLLYRFLIRLNCQILLSCDFHGHSRKKNAFIFGCENPAGTEIEGLEKIFPQILTQQASIFDFNSCRFNIEKSKESTARVVLRQEFKIINSFTLESTYCGMDFGEKRGMQVQIPDLEKMGVDFAKAVNTLLNHTEVHKMCSKNIVDLSKSVKSTPCSSDQSPVATPKRPRKVKKSTAKQLAKKSIEAKKKEKKPPVREEQEENSDNSDDDSDDG
ncbi:Cytosolic carboxypeptidase 1 [Boothiomyces macroporosus]|uniref:Cytosolic carboxypeptidase 1 n=1 Tax=Boothiomyces macroporosus TaxID=261099 RepID=A0AAD5UDT8_9FUNG|nr:Cytosolic carboxypeptidase 1 [Boothiomyces macroporosus]KAJ3255502.1 Cytosolic carboxypeptidase 1 [Boothiomyces macroporosus]